MLRGMRKLRAEERLFNPQAFQDEADRIGAKQREYKSRFCLAGGDYAYGIISIANEAAIGPLSWAKVISGSWR